MTSNLFFHSIIFIFGLAVGSFLNSVIYRLENGLSFLWSRSFCPNCRHSLSWRDLIPLLSFIALKGRCRYCSQRISLQYPLLEATTGLLFLLIFANQFPISNLSEFITFCFIFLIFCLLIIIFVYDLKHYIIPDKVVYPAILASGIWYFISSVLGVYTKYEILTAIYSALGAAAFFLIVVLISRGRWMGLGDVKLAFLMGMVLSFPGILVALFLAFLGGAIIGIALVILGRKTLKSEVPFGPFLITGTFIAFFFGEKIINAYLALII